MFKTRCLVTLATLLGIAAAALILWTAFDRVQQTYAGDSELFRRTAQGLRRWDRTKCRLFFEFGGRLMTAGEPQWTGIDGQKAVCLDPGVAPEPGACLVYSFGISDDWSFDQVMESYGCDVFAFDPSLPPTKRRPPASASHVQFFPVGLGVRNTDADVENGGWRMRRFDSIRRYLRHQQRTIDYLKIDIEGAEWAVLNQLVETHQLRDVKQLAVELHLTDVHQMVDYGETIAALEASGFVRFFSRENPWMRRAHQAKLGVADSIAYEVAWLNTNYSKVDDTAQSRVGMFDLSGMMRRRM